MKKNNIVWIEGHFARTDEDPVNRIAVFQQEKNELKEEIVKLKTQIGKMKECANCPVWLLNQTEKNCKDCEYKEALILLRR